VSLHAGTVTFLFSDIEGSTELLKAVGDPMYARILEEHRQILREAFAVHGGREIDTQGDAFFYAFGRARDAVAAAVEAQRALALHAWPDGRDVRVRMGLHTGEPVVGDEGYTGLDVVRAARIAAVGHGGQVLLSETTRALIGPDLPQGVNARALGEQRLKDIDRPEPLHELVIDGVSVTQAPISQDSEEDPVSFGKRISRMIESKVLRELEESLGDADRSGR
jgi:class 3 adenylate cyclase